MKLNKSVKLLGILLLAVCTSTMAFAQDKIVDQIVAIVGSNIILKSDVERMHIDQQAQGITSDGDMKCEILENFLIDKLLIAEAELDTLIEVTDNQVNQQMDAQLQSYIAHFGTEKAVEDYFKKSIALIKSEMQEAIRNQLFSSQMRNKIVENVNVTPSEVRFHFRSLKQEEIPTIPTQYEYAQITFPPKIELEEENRVKATLREYKKRIEDGTSFAMLAVMYSQDPSAARAGGEIGYLGRAELDPTYATAAFNLKGDKVSNVVKSSFGYHIVQLIDKRDDKVNTRHILMKPTVTVEAKEKAFEQLDSLSNIIRKNEIPFNEAAMRFSFDKNTRNNGGVAINGATMSSKFTVEELDSDASKILTTMNVNEISNPFVTVDPENQQTIYKTVKLINKIESHKANMQNDYQQLAAMYLATKKEEVLQNWISERQAETYIRIDDTYARCNFNFDNWVK
ncbi:MAG: peptidylprolyl isomerase [Prolixibacteraceae bacterium]|jgi:peptidyl-prolyl cis-trans isomerase SurA|nr:peptidylprolyl isomerase [Prolixibacteraceae bacterium]MBT6764639.1 peptidylprolyl isomerase [Prolixibacteraceae bacterium]MBT6999538.1 peptidylprolyl isomerase [Prolixibacteraceae bacterium]MBT7396778.1 peptidylprolyl isomerase [Prolixibacteraceae bacterium]